MREATSEGPRQPATQGCTRSSMTALSQGPFNAQKLSEPLMISEP